MVDFLLPLRGVQFLFTIICLGLSGYAADWWDDLPFTDTPSEISFMVFVSVWTLLVLPYLALAPTMFSRFANKYAILALDALTMLFWFAGFIALAVYRDDFPRCSGTRACDTLTAAIVFGAFEWLLFTATTVLAALHVLKTRGSSSSQPAAHAHMQPGGGVTAV
jgi:uncharacterized membrane protein (DUF485 family)